jgi:hypothetical protein
MMKPVTLNQKAHHVVRFVLIQFIALLGWILVQVFFSLSPLGRTLPFTFLICTEAIWWMALLLIMLLLFLLEYQRFVQATRDLEEANIRLRRATNSLLEQIRIDHPQAATPSPNDSSE